MKTRRMAVLLAAALVFMSLPGERSRAADVATKRLDADEFRVEFACAFREGDSPALRSLAAGHRDLLRPLAEDLLSQYSRAAGNKEDGRAVLAMARACAEEAFHLSSDDWLLRRTGTYASWSPDEHRNKLRADALADQAGKAFAQGRYGEVADPARQALEAYVSLNEEAGQGDVLHFLGQADRKLARYREALSWHGKALVLARRAGDRRGQARALIDLGDVHERQKDRARAEELYGDALAILKIPEDWREAGRALRQLGDIHTVTGDFDRAYRAYRTALSYAEEARDAVHIAEFHDYLGFCHRRLGDFERAMDHHRCALAGSAQIRNDELRAAAQARAFNHLGLCAAKLAEMSVIVKRPDKAAELYREALASEEKSLALSRAAQDRWRQGYVLRALSLIHRELGEILPGEEAEREYGKALARSDEALALARSMKEREWEGLALHHKALALLNMKREEEGLQEIRQAMRLWDEIGDLQSLGYAYWLMGRRFYEQRGILGEAQACYARAASCFEKIGDAESRAGTLLDQARISGLQGWKEEALGFYEKGLAGLERVRAKAGLPEFKKAFLGKILDRYEEAALYALESGLPDLAFRYTESMRARAFLDQLAESRVDLEKGIYPGLKKKRDELEKNLSAALNGLADEYRKQPPDEARLDSWRREHDRLSGDLEALQREIRLKNSMYASVQYPQPVTVPELRSEVLQPGEILLEYFLSARGVFCFAVTKDRFEAVRLPIGKEALLEAAEALLANIESGPRRGEGFDRLAAADLYDALLKPMEPMVEGKRILVAPDGILARLPFEALVVTDGDRRSYLLETHAVRYVQSASVLAMLRRQYGNESPNEGFLGFGDPVFDYENFRAGRPEHEGSGDGEIRGAGLAGTRYADLGGRLGRLQASGDEVRAIGDIFRQGKKEARELLRIEAREEQAKGEEIGKYGYIHLSTHGILSPKLQSIAFSQIPGSAEDGFLSIGEIMNLKIRARMVVLSACQTGLGRMERGEGVTGLARAVMYAGSPAVVVSLWSVDDTGTRELMVGFYDHIIRKGAAKDDALREAKREMLKTRFRHPFFWSAFVMYGE